MVEYQCDYCKTFDCEKCDKQQDEFDMYLDDCANRDVEEEWKL